MDLCQNTKVSHLHKTHIRKAIFLLKKELAISWLRWTQNGEFAYFLTKAMGCHLPSFFNDKLFNSCITRLAYWQEIYFFLCLVSFWRKWQPWQKFSWPFSCLLRLTVTHAAQICWKLLKVAHMYMNMNRVW